MILALLKRAAGFGYPGTPSTAQEPVRVEAFQPVFQPSILDREQMEIDEKRERLTLDAEDFDAAADYHEKQAASFRDKKSDTLRILDGLRKHEAIVQAKAEDALIAAGLEIEAALDIDVNPHDAIADEIERNLMARSNGTERRPKRASEKAVLAMAE